MSWEGAVILAIIIGYAVISTAAILFWLQDVLTYRKQKRKEQK